MGIYVWNKQLKEAYIGSTPVKEIYHWNTKVRPEKPEYNLDLENWKPIGRMNDWELWFRVNVKDASEPFKIAVNGYNGISYDWDISIDGAVPIRKTGNRSTTTISLPMSVGKHYVKVTPHNGVVAGWARCMGNGGWTNFWNNDRSKITVSLEWLPWYAFMIGEAEVGHEFLRSFRTNCASLISMPHGFNLPKGITSVKDKFLFACRAGCAALTIIPEGFNIPQALTSVNNYFISSCWYNCVSLKTIPDEFNIPQGVTSVGFGFLTNCRNGCRLLTSIPDKFNIPQGITSVGDGFLSYCRHDCRSLTSNSPAKPLRFPNVSGNNFGNSCFWWTCPIIPDTPTPGSSVMIRRSS